MASTNADGRVSYTEHELKDPELQQRLRLQVGKENTPWLVEVGTNYSPPYTNDETSNDSSKVSPPKPVQKTESLSPRPQEVVDSSATSTGGAGPKTESQPSGKPARPQRRTPAKKQARTHVIDSGSEFDDFE